MDTEITNLDTEGVKIITSKKVVYSRIFILGTILFFACAMLTIFYGLFSFGTKFGLFIFITIWIVSIIIWIVGSLFALRSYNFTLYVLGKDSLAITKGGMFNSVTDLYRYDSIISVRISQDLSGKIFGYSNLVINIPKLQRNVTLSGVIEPIQQAESIKQRINALQPTKIA